MCTTTDIGCGIIGAPVRNFKLTQEITHATPRARAGRLRIDPRRGKLRVWFHREERAPLMSISIPLTLMMLLSTGCATEPADASAPPAPAQTGAPAEQGKLTADSDVDRILDALDARGEDLRSLAADVKLRETDTTTGDDVVRDGRFALELRPDGAARSRIVFEKRTANNRVTEEKIEYLLDGQNLIDRAYRTKTQVTRQVLRPGERLNLLKLGEGPFPLPIGQDKEEVHRLFDVKKVAPTKDDPPNTVHVQLTPKPGSQFADRFSEIHAWVDLEDHMPKRIETVDANGVTVRTTDLSNVRINENLGEETFRLEKIDEQQWNLLNEAHDR